MTMNDDLQMPTAKIQRRKRAGLLAVSVLFVLIWLFCIYIIYQSFTGSPSRALVRAIGGVFLIPYALYVVLKSYRGLASPPH